MTGLINLYKPKGITSSNAVIKVKKILSTKAVGHMGTLDPQGEGVLILGVGKATRLFDYFLSKDKVYEADFTFGYETDTLDGDGKILYNGGNIPLTEQIEEAIGKFIGKLEQIPPLYSAKKLNGRKAYDMARNGDIFTLAPCSVEVYSFDLIGRTEDTIRVKIHCSSGTYIRSLCRDLAHLLGAYATMTAIKRVRCGNFDISDSVRIDELSLKNVIGVEDSLPELSKIILPEEQYKKISNGVPIEYDRTGKFLVFCRGELFGIGEAKDGFLKISTYLRES